jgi:dynein heavy chain
MEELTNSFQNIIKDFQNKRHDLMDYAKNNFDLEYVKFTVEIQGLDTRLQSFIDENFSRFRNIEYSIRLLHKFENTLKRDTLRHSLTNKYNSIL